jgi:hypothetical protein
MCSKPCPRLFFSTTADARSASAGYLSSTFNNSEGSAMPDPHEQKRVTRDHYHRKTELAGRIFAILDWQVDDRGLTLMPHLSRAVRRREVLELILTDEKDAQPGDTINRVAYLGFIEMGETGLLVSGDRVSINDETIGEVVGFDETHMPNHLNMILRVDERQTGREMALKLDTLCRFAGIEEDRNREIGF